MFKKQPKSWFFEKIHTSDKTPARLIRGKKMEKIQIINNSIERGDISRDSTNIKRITRKYEQLYAHKFDNSVEMDKFFERHKLLIITLEEIDKLSSHIYTIKLNFPWLILPYI